MRTKLLLYNSLVLSHLNFSILAWGYKCNRIIKLQKKAIRILCKSKFNAHTEPLFKNLNLLKVEDIKKLQELKFYYKYKHDILPYYLQHIPFVCNNNIHNHATRIHNNIHLNRTHHDYTQLCIRHDLPQLINSTPIKILEKIDSHCLKGFAAYIKTFFINSYQDICTIPNCYICSRQFNTNSFYPHPDAKYFLFYLFCYFSSWLPSHQHIPICIMYSQMITRMKT